MEKVKFIIIIYYYCYVDLSPYTERTHLINSSSSSSSLSNGNLILKIEVNRHKPTPQSKIIYKIQWRRNTYPWPNGEMK